MGQKPHRNSSEHPNPHHRRKWVVHLPQNCTIGFDPQQCGESVEPALWDIEKVLKEWYKKYSTGARTGEIDKQRVSEPFSRQKGHFT